MVFAVTFAASHDSPEKAPERFQSFLARGDEVATGESLWDEPIIPPPHTSEALAANGPRVENGEAPDDRPARPSSKRARRLEWD